MVIVAALSFASGVAVGKIFSPNNFRPKQKINFVRFPIPRIRYNTQIFAAKRLGKKHDI